MSMDRSLKSGNLLARHRNVLTRAERVERLASQDRWTEERGVLGLPKVANRKAAIGKKKTVKKPEEEAAKGGKKK